MVKPGDTVYLVKYALSDGIQEHVVRAISSDGRRISLVGYLTYYTANKEVHQDRIVASAVADAMRVKKIASLRKQITKLEKMDFTEIKESKNG